VYLFGAKHCLLHCSLFFRHCTQKMLHFTYALLPDMRKTTKLWSRMELLISFILIFHFSKLLSAWNVCMRFHSPPDQVGLTLSLVAHDNVVIKTLCYKPEGRGFETRWGEWSFPNYLILPTAVGPLVYPIFNRNEYHKQKIMFLGSRVRPVQRSDNPAVICEPFV
jgi:hypothetical protein